jgi:hypothetical protein
MNLCWKEAKYLLLFSSRNFVLLVLEITDVFLGNISKDLSMNCCLPPNNRRTYLIDVTFMSMLKDFLFSGDLPLFFRNALMNCRSEICRISARTCFEVMDCNFLFSSVHCWCNRRIPAIRIESLLCTTTWMLWKQLSGLCLTLDIYVKNEFRKWVHFSNLFHIKWLLGYKLTLKFMRKQDCVF